MRMGVGMGGEGGQSAPEACRNPAAFIHAFVLGPQCRSGAWPHDRQRTVFSHTIHPSSLEPIIQLAKSHPSIDPCTLVGDFLCFQFPCPRSYFRWNLIVGFSPIARLQNTLRYSFYGVFSGARDRRCRGSSLGGDRVNPPSFLSPSIPHSRSPPGRSDLVVRILLRCCPSGEVHFQDPRTAP